MGVGSILLGIAAFLFMFGGFLTSVIPVVGTLLSFAAPLLAIGGIVTGGLGLSRAKRDGEPTGMPTAGLIVSIVALIPALLVALTCGLCNACFTAGMMSPQQGNQQWWLDGGGPMGPGLSPSPGSPFGPSQPGQPPGQQPGQAPPGFPPPAFPPPPLDDDGQPPAGDQTSSEASGGDQATGGEEASGGDAPPAGDSTEPPADPAPGQTAPGSP